jgi:hypothetical protein
MVDTNQTQLIIKHTSEESMPNTKARRLMKIKSSSNILLSVSKNIGRRIQSQAE